MLDDPSSHERPPPIVAIGASAGGLAAFEAFFRALPDKPGLAAVLIPHLDPKRHSQMAELIAKYTNMPVSQIADGTRIEIDHVYIIPPNNYLSIRDGRLKLEKPIEYRGIRMAIDYSFRSLAESQQERSICILLSGSGSDGTQGLKAVKEVGGLAIVQEPATAQHDGMLSSALRTGMVDLVLPPEDMPKVLVDYLGHHYVRESPEAEAPPDESAARQVDKILAVIKARQQHDFTRYKRGTIIRRIHRRMGLQQIQHLPDYLTKLRKDQAEVGHLFADLLIGVTQFFRDPETFAELEATAIRELVCAHEGRPLRIWVSACSTGEEAFSLVISFLEVARELGKPVEMQVFATDVDERALSYARNAVYPDSIVGDIPKNRLQHYFQREDKSYRVSKHVREMVVFARQDLIYDPPFSKLDLITCRNLLIYLEPETQHKVISMFSFSLRESSYLFLGGSESIGRAEKLFEPVGKKKARIFLKVQRAPIFDRAPFPVEKDNQRPATAPFTERTAPALADKLGAFVHNDLLARHAPPSIVVRANLEIVHFYGQTSDFLEMPTGAPSQDLMLLAKRGLRVILRQAIRLAFQSDEAVGVRGRLAGPARGEFDITATRFQLGKSDSHYCLVSFRKVGENPGKTTTPATPSRQFDEESAIAQIDNELKTTREELQCAIEELETSNEELKTSNEEAMSMNEELQSTNEELETSKEELQSLNEELSTVNSELQEKFEETQKINDDLGNLLASTDLATLFLDSGGRIRRFTPSAKKLFRLIGTDIGRPIRDIASRLKSTSKLVDDAARVVQDLQPIQDEVQDESGNWYMRRLMPYRTSKNLVDGVVITFTDVTALKQAGAKLEQSEARYRSLYEDNPAMCFTLNAKREILSVNRFGARQLGQDAESLCGQQFKSLAIDPEQVESALDRATTITDSLERLEARFNVKQAEPIWARGVIRAITDEPGLVYFVVCQDVSAEMRLTDEIRFNSSHDYLTGLLNRREFEAKLTRVLESHDNGVGHTLLYIDLARFKLINDTGGHAAGDAALREFANIVKRQARGRDVIARLGGDEFGILMEYCPVPDAQRVCKSILESLHGHEFKHQDHSFSVDCYMGLVELGGEELALEEAIRRADSACYAARDAGPGSIQVYDESSSEISSHRAKMQWGAVIRSAISEDKFALVCSPIIGAHSNRPVAYEFLLRLEDEYRQYDTGSLVSAAEHYGMAPQLDAYVTRKALSELEANISALSDVDFVSINLSGQSIGQNGFSDNILEALQDCGVPKSKICFEITETATIVNRPQAIDFVKTLRGCGCRIAIDDFGSGLASFHYLKELPCDIVKIDGQFVRNLAYDASDRALVSSIDGIAKLLGLKTIAEFVETEQVDKIVRDIGVSYRQGHKFGLPQPLQKALSLRS